MGGHGQETAGGAFRNRLLEGHVANHRSDPERVAVLGQVVELVERVDVDQNRGTGQAEVHGRDQALAAGQDLGLVAVLAQVSYRFGHGAGLVVVEWSRLHEGRSVVSGRQPEAFTVP